MAEQVGLSVTCLETLMTGFLMMRPIWSSFENFDMAVVRIKL